MEAERNWDGSGGETPLILCARRHNVELAKILVDHGANLQAKNHSDKTALDLAFDDRDVAMVKLLVSSGTSIVTTSEVEHLLVELAGESNLELVTLLLRLGVDISSRSWRRCTALHLAAGNGKSRMVEFLISMNAPLEAQDVDGNTPLHQSIGYYNKKASRECTKLLLRAGANTTALDQRGRSILSKAIKKGDIEIAKELLASGIDVVWSRREANVHYGNRPLHVAAEANRPCIVAMLLRKGANPFTVNWWGRKASEVDNPASSDPEVDLCRRLLIEAESAGKQSGKIGELLRKVLEDIIEDPNEPWLIANNIPKPAENIPQPPEDYPQPTKEQAQAWTWKLSQFLSWTTTEN